MTGGFRFATTSRGWTGDLSDCGVRPERGSQHWHRQKGGGGVDKWTETASSRLHQSVLTQTEDQRYLTKIREHLVQV